jgi:hypothetical protein
MSENVNDGGRAFPFAYETESTRHISYGMTLRDYFAAHASDADIDKFMPETIGDRIRMEKEDGQKRTRQRARYLHADAMIEARGK